MWFKTKREEGASPERSSRRASHWSLGLLLGLVVFALGVGVGEGRISFNSNTPANNDLPARLNYTDINEVYQALRLHYDGSLTESQLIDGLKHGLAEATHDPYTEYFTTKEAKEFEGQLNNSFSGIGAELGKDKDDNLIIVAPMSGFPADKAGLKAQDIITNINGQSTTGLAIDEAVGKIRGPEGTQVTLQIVRNKSQQLTLTVTRQNIQIPSVTSKMLDNNIGYIQIISFSDDTSSLIQQAADKMAAAHTKGVVLDLRDDPGGDLQAAIDVASEWLPDGKMVLQERGTSGAKTYTAEGDPDLRGIPTVVLINNGSASASEIVAGALHDNGAARLIGTKSYGKGVVQQLIPFDDGSKLKVTIASWYRPNGQNINKKGIEPDQAVQEPSDATADNDPQLKAAEAYLAK